MFQKPLFRRLPMQGKSGSNVNMHAISGTLTERVEVKKSEILNMLLTCFIISKLNSFRQSTNVGTNMKELKRHKGSSSYLVHDFFIHFLFWLCPIYSNRVSPQLYLSIHQLSTSHCRRSVAIIFHEGKSTIL